MDKKAILKQGIFVVSILSIIFILLFKIISINAYDLKENYLLNDKIKLDLSKDITKIRFQTPTQLSVIKPQKNLVLKLNEIGKYSITFYGEEVKEYGFNVVKDLNEVNQNINFSKDINYDLNNLSNISSNLSKYENSKVVVNQNVYWKKNIFNESDLDNEISNISIYAKNITYNRSELKSRGKIELFYETEGPKKKEYDVERKIKKVEVYSSLDYGQFVVFTNISQLVKNESNIKVLSEDGEESFEFDSYDLDNNGLIDYIEWISPDSNNRTFLIIVIINAEHLNEKKEFISNIYEEVRALDGNWSETIYDKEYVRVKFESNLTKDNDITIFPKTISGKPKIEIYEINGEVKIAEFNQIYDNELNKVLLTDLIGEQDSFDLRVVGGEVEFDYIVDPTFISGNEAHDVSFAILNETNGMFVMAWCDDTADSAAYRVMYTNGSAFGTTQTFDAGTGDSCRISVSALNATAFTISYIDWVANSADWILRGYTINNVLLWGPTSIDADMNSNVDIDTSAWNSTHYVSAVIDDTDNQATFVIYNMGTSVVAQTDIVTNSPDTGCLDQDCISVSAISTTSWVSAYFNEDDDSLYYTMRNQAGTQTLAPTIISPSALDGAVGSAALRNGGFVIAYCDSTDDDISFQTYTSGGVSVSGEIDVNQSVSTCAGAASTHVGVSALNTTDGQFVIFYDNALDDRSYFAIYNYSGEEILSNTFVSATDTVEKTAIVSSYDKISGKELCYYTDKDVLLVGYNDATNSNWLTYYVNGSSWDGDCRDKLSPEIILSSPLNNTVTNVTLQTFVCNLSDKSQISNVTFYVLNSSGIYNQTTRSISGLTNSTSLNITLTSNNYNWSCYARDSFNNGGYSLYNYSLIIDNVAPSINFTNPSEQNDTYINRKNILVNVSAQDSLTNINITINIYNSTGSLINYSSSLSSPFFYNFSVNDDGTYYFNATVKDIMNNTNYTQTRKINIHTVPPSVYVHSPISHFNYSNSFILFNISSDENSTANYSLNGGVTNYSMSSNSSGTGFNATNNSIADGNYLVRFYVYDRAGNVNSTQSVNFSIDTLPPQIQIYNPINSNYSYNLINLNFSVIDIGVGRDSCFYSLNGEDNVSLLNCDNSSILANQGNNNLILYANDSSGNLNYTNVSFFVDSVNPGIRFIPPTASDGSSRAEKFIYAEVEIIEQNFANITYVLYNSTEIVNITTYYTNVSYINWTGLNNSNMQYFYNVSIYDGVGNYNTTGTRTLNLTLGDISPPDIFFNSPISNGYYFNYSNILINVTLSEEADKVFYSLNGGVTNYSMSNLTLFTYNATNYSTPDGFYRLNVYANDSIGNFGSRERNFTLDTTYPLVNYSVDSTNDGLNLSFNHLYINVSIVEINEANISFNLYNSSGIVNSTSYNDGTHYINFTNLIDGDYYYNVSVTDLANNINHSLTRRVRIDTAFPNILLIAPISNSYFNNSLLNLSSNISDNLGLSNVSLFVYNSSGNLINKTDYNYFGLNLILGISINLPYDDNFSWRYGATDSSGNFNFSNNWSFIIDTTKPLVGFVVPTKNDGANISGNSILVNVSIVEINEANISFNLYNSSGIVNSTSYNDGAHYINFTNLMDGDYYYNVSVTDLANNINHSLTRKITLDNVIPVINNISDDPDPFLNGSMLNITANVTDNLRVGNVWVGIEGINYTLYSSFAEIYNVSINTSIYSIGYHNYTVYANDSVGNVANFLNGSFRNVYDYNAPVINNISDDPDPSVFTRLLNITANVTDDTSVQSVWVEIIGVNNYSLSHISGNVYGNNQISTLDIGVGYFEYVVYARDSSLYETNSSIGNFTINEGNYITNVSVRAANPSSLDWDRSGPYGIILFNPLNSSMEITFVNISSNATGAVFSSITQGAGNSFPTSGWTLTNNREITWTGSYSLDSQEAMGFYITATSNKVGETFRIKYSATINNTLYSDPHTHLSTQSSTNGVPFVSLAFDNAYPHYNETLRGNAAKTFSVSMVESSGRGTIGTGIVLTINVPEGFTNVVSNGGTGWGSPTISGNTINVTNTATVSNSRITYSFNATAPAGTAAQGLYTMKSYLTGVNANAEFEAALKVFDGDAPIINLYQPFNNYNITGFNVSPFNYSVSDASTLTSCELWGNWTGSFAINQTVNSPSRETINNFSRINVTDDGFYIWNIKCTDQYGNFAFNTSNYTFGAFEIPSQSQFLNASLSSNDGKGNVTLYWDDALHALSYRVYKSNSLNGNFVLVNLTNNNNYTDYTFSGNKRMFYKIESVNPVSSTNSSDYFGVHVYTLSHTTNTRNWIGFPSNSSLIKNASSALSEIRNATAFSMWNATLQRRVTCNDFSCPTYPACPENNCNFNIVPGNGYEVNINSSAPINVNWSMAGVVFGRQNISLIKNSTGFGKNWIAINANTTLINAQNLYGNITGADAVSSWNSSSQTSLGLVKNPLPFGPAYIGNNFIINLETGYEVSVNDTYNWSQR